MSSSAGVAIVRRRRIARRCSIAKPDVSYRHVGFAQKSFRFLLNCSCYASTIFSLLHVSAFCWCRVIYIDSPRSGLLEADCNNKKPGCISPRGKVPVLIIPHYAKAIVALKHAEAARRSFFFARFQQPVSLKHEGPSFNTFQHAPRGSFPIARGSNR